MFAFVGMVTMAIDYSWQCVQITEVYRYWDRMMIIDTGDLHDHYKSTAIYIGGPDNTGGHGNTGLYW